MAARGRARVTVGDRGVGVPSPRARGLLRLHGLNLPPQHEVVEAVQVLGGDGASHLGKERELEVGTSGALSWEPTSGRDSPPLPQMTYVQTGPLPPPSLTLCGSPLPSGEGPNTFAWTPGQHHLTPPSWHLRLQA